MSPLQAVSSLAIAIILLNANCYRGINAAQSQSPILIVHGYTASQLYVQDSSDTDCNTNGRTVRIWTNATYVATAPECLLKQFTLSYMGDQYSDAMDVTVTTADFGNISSLADLGGVSTPMIDYFVNRGYTVDVNLRAAPYDWRLGAEQLNERGYYSNLKQLVQRMYEDNGNTKVTLVVISMGGPVSHYFLTQVVDQQWKDTYIHAYVSLSAAWAGVPNFLPPLLTPPEDSLFLGFPINASTNDIFDVYRTLLSIHWLVLRSNNITLVSTPTRNYTSSQYQELFTDAGYPQGYTKITQNDLDFQSPNVPVYCFYGLGLQTPLTYIYDNSFPDTQPSFTFGDGDATVNKESLEVCQNWADSGYPFNRTVFPGRGHLPLISDEAVLQAIEEIVRAPMDPTNSAWQVSTLNSLFVVIILLVLKMVY